MDSKKLTKQKIIIEYIKRNPNATYKDIREKTKLHPERFFKTLAEAFKEAKVKAPRNFKRKTKEERQKIIIKFIKKNPKVGGHIISKATKISINSAFKNIKEAYEKAGVEYPRKKSYNKSPGEKRGEILKLVKENPYITIPELTIKSKANPYKLFKNFKEIYKKAGIKKINQGEKIRNRKRKDVINFIKNNNLATQREINNTCKTHVQYLFKKGIFEAYEKAGIKYPFERLKLYGTALKEIKKRARDFEEQIAVILSGYGKVNRLVKTKRGVADIILERKNKKIAVEVKDYQNKEICFSQVKQLNKYLEDLNTDLGLLICHKKPKKDKFIIGKRKIFILEKQELNKIIEIV
jgi:predicted HTH transcriptional regulator